MIQKHSRQHPSPPYDECNLLDSLKIYFQIFFVLSFFAFNIKWTKWQLIDIDCDFATNFCAVYLLKAHNYLISSNVT